MELQCTAQRNEIMNNRWENSYKVLWLNYEDTQYFSSSISTAINWPKKYSFTEISEQNLTVTAQKVNIKTNYMINDATTLASSSLTKDIFCWIQCTEYH